MSRVAVVHATDPNRPTVIDSAVYDPAVHVLWLEADPPAEPPDYDDVTFFQGDEEDEWDEFPDGDPE